MGEEKRIEFSASDKNVSSFMSKIRQDSKRMFDEQLSNAKKLTSETKDQIKFLKDYIEQLKIKSKLEKESVRGTFASGRGAAYGNIFYKNTEQGRASFESAARTAGIYESAQVGTLKEMLNEMKKGADLTPQRKQSIFSEVLKAGLFRDFSAIVGQIPGARTGLEAIPTMMGLSGAGVGALAGAPFMASAAGAQLGKSAGEFAANAMVRHITEASRYTGAVGRLRGAGGGTGVEDLSYLGMDFAHTAGLREQLVRATGISNQGASHLAEVMKAYSIDAGTITGYSGGARYGGSLTSMNRLLGTAGEGNRSSFDRLIQNMTQLTNLIAQSTLTPNSSNIAKSLFEFNRVGGPFGISDPRSMGLMSTINESITNPSSPLGQAMNYSILRRMNPGMGIASLLEQQQMGISNRGLTSGILNEIEQMGGNEDFKILATAQRFGLQGNIGAARKLFNNRGAIGGMTDQDFKEFTDAQIRGEAQANIAPLEVNTAKITNAFVVSMSAGIATVTSTFATEMSEVSKLIAKEFAKAFGFSSTHSSNDAVWDKYARKVK